MGELRTCGGPEDMTAGRTPGGGLVIGGTVVLGLVGRAVKSVTGHGARSGP